MLCYYSVIRIWCVEEGDGDNERGVSMRGGIHGGATCPSGGERGHDQRHTWTQPSSAAGQPVTSARYSFWMDFVRGGAAGRPSDSAVSELEPLPPPVRVPLSGNPSMSLACWNPIDSCALASAPTAHSKTPEIATVVSCHRVRCQLSHAHLQIQGTHPPNHSHRNRSQVLRLALFNH